MDEEQLKVARILLKDVAAAKARREWKTKRGDAEALRTRVMIQEVINKGNEAALESLASYFGIHIKPRKDAGNRLPDGVFVACLGNGEVVAIKIEKVSNENG